MDVCAGADDAVADCCLDWLEDMSTLLGGGWFVLIYARINYSTRAYRAFDDVNTHCIDTQTFIERKER